MRTHSMKLPVWLSRAAAISWAMVAFSVALAAQPGYQPRPKT